MKINGRPFRTIWPNEDGAAVDVIDQTKLPHIFATRTLRNLDDAAIAIRDMIVRGAPLIGATAAYGLALAMRADSSDANLAHAAAMLLKTRPTAVNLAWAVNRLRAPLAVVGPGDRAALAWRLAAQLSDEDVAQNSALGEAGATLLQAIWEKKKRSGRVNVLTHCNAGWLATVDWGTALAPIYKAHDAGIPLHVFVDETRPRNQGAALTAWELASHDVPHALIVDNAGGHLMQRGEIDICIVGADRVTADGSACNKIGTYLKALAARDNNVPFHVALPSPTIDWSMASGADVPIEERSAREVTHLSGRAADGSVVEILLGPEQSPARNPAFDVTPPRLVTGFITERGLCGPGAAGLRGLFPERAAA